MADRVWKSKDGKTLAVSAMADTHIINAIKMLVRNAIRSRDLVTPPAFTEGTMADCLATQDWEAMQDEDGYELAERFAGDKFTWLTDELDNRKIPWPDVTEDE